MRINKVWGNLVVGMFMLTSACVASAAPVYTASGDPIPFNYGVTQLLYANKYNALIARNSGSAIGIINLANKTVVSVRQATGSFTDMDITASGRYIYVADYGGENIGYGTPLNTSYVHRLDLESKSWAKKPTAQIAGRIAAVSDNRFVLSSLDQWVTFSYQDIGTGPSTVMLNTAGPYWNAYYAGVYRGQIKADLKHGRLIHGNSGLSSQEVTAFTLVNNEFSKKESSGTYGSASGYGENVVLSNDYSGVYYGRLKVDPLDVRYNQVVFPEVIYGATGDVAFGGANYYDAKTGALLGSYGFKTTVIAVNPNGQDFWALDQDRKQLVRMVLSAN